MRIVYAEVDQHSVHTHGPIFLGALSIVTQPQFYKHALCVVLCTSVAPVCAQPPRGPCARVRARILMLHNLPTTVLTTPLPRRQGPHIVHSPSNRLALITRHLLLQPSFNCSYTTRSFRNKALLQLFTTHHALFYTQNTLSTGCAHPASCCCRPHSQTLR